MQRAQHRRRELDALVPLQVIEDNLLILELGFTCHPPLYEDAAELHGMGSVPQSVIDGQRVFAFVEVLAEAFCLFV